MLKPILFLNTHLVFQLNFKLRHTNGSKFSQIEGPLYKNNTPQPNSFTKLMLWNDNLSPNGKGLYFTRPDSEGNVLYRIDLERENSLEMLVKGYVTDLVPLSDGNLLLSGNINGEGGFIYMIHKLKGVNYWQRVLYPVLPKLLRVKSLISRLIMNKSVNYMWPILKIISLNRMK